MRRWISLSGRREFSLVLRRGRKASTRDLVAFAVAPRNDGTPTKIGIVITAKVGKAVDRNLLRRRCKAIIDSGTGLPAGAWFVVHCRPGSAGLSFAQLREQLTAALERSVLHAQKRTRAGDGASGREALLQ